MKTLTKNLIDKGNLQSSEIIFAFNQIDRADFIGENKKLAYLDQPLSIGEEQTISQPTTVAIMLELLQAKKGDKILDIGFGSGWTTALLANLVGNKGEVYAIEIVKDLFKFGKKNLAKYNFKNVELFNQDGSRGLLQKAPFDKILASAAVQNIPEELKNQLSENGVMVIPVQDMLVKVTKEKNRYHYERYPYFSFVSMRGKFENI